MQMTRRNLWCRRRRYPGAGAVGDWRATHAAVKRLNKLIDFTFDPRTIPLNRIGHLASAWNHVGVGFGYERIVHDRRSVSTKRVYPVAAFSMKPHICNRRCAVGTLEKNT